jgi:hypothetical protein
MTSQKSVISRTKEEGLNGTGMNFLQGGTPKPRVSSRNSQMEVSRQNRYESNDPELTNMTHNSINEDLKENEDSQEKYSDFEDKEEQKEGEKEKSKQAAKNEHQEDIK